MIRSISVLNYTGELMTMELANPAKSGFAVMKVEGIGGPKSDVNITEVVTADGGLFNSSRMTSREIKMKLRFIGTDIEAIRHKSYKFFPSKRPVTLLFETSRRSTIISGYVEKNEVDVFSKDEGSEITILCPDPYFYSVANNETVFSGIEPMMEFPFENDSLTEKMIEMGKVLTKQYETVYYDGDGEIGVNIEIHSLGTAGTITIYNIDTRQSMRIDNDKLAEITGSGITTGDTIYICTEKFNKSITLLRSGISINILNCLDRGTDWFTLIKGDNVFAYVAEEGSSNLQFKIINRTLYEGV